MTAARGWSYLVASSLALTALAEAPSARAQWQSAQWQTPTLDAHVAPERVEVGEPFEVSLDAKSAAGGASTPVDPRLSVPRGMAVSGPSTSTRTELSIVNGRTSQHTGVTFTWRVTPSHEGRFTVGPPSVLLDGVRLQTPPLHVTVGPAGSHPHAVAPPGGNVSPFDPFSLFPKFPGLFGNVPPADDTPPPPVDPALAMDAPLDQTVFLRSTLDKQTAVVGEQVTATVYLYTRRSIETTDVHEPSVPDFFRRDLMSPSAQPDAQLVPIAGVIWHAQPLFRVALFPLKSGDLEVGAMSMSILGVGHGTGARGGVERKSAPLRVHVTEPPMAGRPSGYQIGDVGHFSMAGSVEPRRGEVGGAVAVNVTLTGVGNLPGALRPPMQKSVEWLDPETHESWDVDGGKVRGSRTYTFLVRPKVAGKVDLGELTLPYWNPDKHAYEVARTTLGSIDVTPGKGLSASEPPAAHNPLSEIGPVRTELATFRSTKAPWTDQRVFWLGLFGAPLAIVAGAAGSRSARRWGQQRSARKQSTVASLELALEEGRAAERKNDAVAVASSAERALYWAIEATTGLRARGYVSDELTRALEKEGVDAALVREIGELLAASEAARFGQAPPSSANVMDRVQAVAKQLSRRAKVAAG